MKLSQGSLLGSVSDGTDTRVTRHEIMESDFSALGSGYARDLEVKFRS